MSNKNTIMVQVLKNQNNSNELFLEWNINKITNVPCGASNCTNDTNDNAYIVTKVASSKEFILPLCNECYKTTTNHKNQSSEDFTDYGTVISIKENLLLEH